MCSIEMRIVFCNMFDIIGHIRYKYLAGADKKTLTLIGA